MDWGKAKSILIFSFLCLNVLLGYQIWSGKGEAHLSQTDASGLSSEILQLMKAKNIQMEAADIPRDIPRLREITVRFDESLTSSAWMNLNPPIRYTPEGRTNLKDLLSRSGFDRLEHYQLDPIVSRNGRYVFHQMHGPYPIFEVVMEFRYDNGEFRQFRQNYVEIEQSVESEEQKIIPAFTAIRTLVENHLAQDTVISDIRLGYHGKIYDSDTQFMPPFWRVALSSGELYYVHAISGAVIDPQRRE